MPDLTDDQAAALDAYVAGPHALAAWQLQVLVDAGLVEPGRARRLTRAGVDAANTRTGAGRITVAPPTDIGLTFGQAIQRRRTR